ncbi:unnamed protein product [Urochloa decumbens]|uniref:F-box domain-containing protein n=1 Tax=Urochloa decumbens TaxID=240449 RepID=A0ABC9ASC7_9POAL
MPLGGNSSKAPVVSGGGCIDSLPDGVLEHMLGFVEAREAVRTCVLARRWRYLWMSATGLRIVYTTYEGKVDYLTAMRKYRQFVDCLLDCRGQAPLETCEISFEGLCDDDDRPCLNHWIRHITCQVQIFRLSNICREDFELDDLPLVSRHLTRLELDGMELSNSFFDFSSCPSLEHLEIATCFLWEANMIMSESIKRLSITNCFFGFRTHVNVPNLVSLRLDSHLYRAPVIERMPALQEAYVRVGRENPNSADCDDEDCYSCHGVLCGDNKKCVLLECLSESENMALISESKTFIFGRDLNKCPIFSKLKTLLLNESWCVAPEFSALTCILKNTPVLGKLTLQLFSKGPKHKVEMIGRFNSMERSAEISEHLKTIEIKCEVVDEEVNEILKFLCTLNICFIFK